MIASFAAIDPARPRDEHCAAGPDVSTARDASAIRGRWWVPGPALGDSGSRRPRSGDELDAAIGADRQVRADPLAQGHAAILGQRHAVRRGRGLAAQKWGPEVVEV